MSTNRPADNATASRVHVTTPTKSVAWWLGGAAVVLIAAVVGAAIGPAGPVWWRVPLALLDRLPFVSVESGVTDAQWNIVWQIRAPRVVLAALVGAMLSIAG
ncbi:MAG: hypothetical protein EBV41_08320, partial [Actinobacteria bacterium]|nr:hypothetical protein [Actinomycetota bacterium]